MNASAPVVNRYPGCPYAAAYFRIFKIILAAPIIECHGPNVIYFDIVDNPPCFRLLSGLIFIHK